MLRKVAHTGSSVSGFALGQYGELYYSSFDDNVVKMVYANGTTVTIAGTGSLGHTGDGGPATKAKLGYLGEVSIEPNSGDIYFVSTITTVSKEGEILSDSGRVRKLYTPGSSPSGAVQQQQLSGAVLMLTLLLSIVALCFFMV